MLDKDLIRRFWRMKAEEGDSRWTDPMLIDHEMAFLAPIIPRAASILDLGCGSGNISRPLCDMHGSLVAVDSEPLMAGSFDGDERFEFRVGNAVDFDAGRVFDAVLLFGVITHLTTEEESAAYVTAARHLASGGVAIVKNQCSTGDEFTVNGFSEALGTDYCGRYPSLAGQTERLEGVFGQVTKHFYPESFNAHSNSQHVAFICKEPRPSSAQQRIGERG